MGFEYRFWTEWPRPRSIPNQKLSLQILHKRGQNQKNNVKFQIQYPSGRWSIQILSNIPDNFVFVWEIIQTVPEFCQRHPSTHLPTYDIFLSVWVSQIITQFTTDSPKVQHSHWNFIIDNHKQYNRMYPKNKPSLTQQNCTRSEPTTKIA